MTERESAGTATVPESDDERAERLRRALTDLGLDARVEARSNLAVLTLAPHSGALAPTLRRACVREAQLAGFTHVALEIAVGNAR